MASEPTTPALPPRPAPIRVIDVDGDRRYFFSGDQLDAYALQSIAADRAAREGAAPAEHHEVWTSEPPVTLSDGSVIYRGAVEFTPDEAKPVSAFYIPGLCSMTDDDDGYVTLRFINETAAQQFMEAYHPTVDYTPPACAAAPRGEAAAQPEPSRPDILEKLTYHQLERDDLTLDEVLDVLAQGWKKVMGRTERQMLLQLCALLAAAPSPTAGAVEPQAEEFPDMGHGWCVAVERDGELELSISEDGVCGKGAPDEALIVGAAKHLLAFVGYGLPPCSFDPDAATPPTPAREGRTDGEPMAGEPRELTEREDAVLRRAAMAGAWLTANFNSATVAAWKEYRAALAARPAEGADAQEKNHG